MKIPADMQVGTIHKTNNSGFIVVVEYKSAKNVVVEFIKTKSIKKTRAEHIRDGLVKDQHYPSVHGFGFVGCGDYEPVKNGVISKAYSTWASMLQRCYDEKYHAKKPTYKNCTVCEEWHNYQNFAAWFDVNYIEGFQLDKDIKVDGNRVYSPGTCLFVSHKDNMIKAAARSYIFISPIGKVVNIYNLAKFCRENNLNPGCMGYVNRGVNSHHKGWTRA